MQFEIITTPLHMTVYGFSGTAINKDYAGTAFRLSGAMWQVVKSHNTKHKGQNIWIYEPGEKVFAGVEMDMEPATATGLEQKIISLNKYAYYKHIGPYNLIKRSGQAMTDELARRGMTTMLPYIEIYGHWNNDETKLETEMLMNLV